MVYIFIYFNGEGPSFICRSRRLKWLSSAHTLSWGVQLLWFYNEIMLDGRAEPGLGGESWGTADFESLVGLLSGVIKKNVKNHFKNFQYFWKFIYKFF